MIIVEMNEDIRKKETKQVGPFTWRQILFMLIGAAYTVPIVLLIPADIGIKVVVAVILLLPAFACGWIKSQGQHFETLAIRFIYYRILTPRERKKKDLEYQKPRKKLARMKERKKLKKMTPKQREAYMKAHKNGTIIYSKDPACKVYR